MRKVLSILLLFVLTFSVSGCYSCQSWHDFWGDGPRGAYPPDKFFWDRDCKPLVDTEPVKPIEEAVK